MFRENLFVLGRKLYNKCTEHENPSWCVAVGNFRHTSDPESDIEAQEVCVTFFLKELILRRGNGYIRVKLITPNGQIVTKVLIIFYMKGY